MATSLNILIDGEVFQQQATGIAKATVGLYKACHKLSPTLQVTALGRSPFQVELPEGFRSIRFGGVIPASCWRHTILPIFSIPYPIIHFPWNGNIPRTLPLNKKKIVTVHDALPLIIPNYFSDERSKSRYCERLQRDLNRADLVITVSQCSKRQIERHFRLRAEPVVIYSGPTLSPQNSTANSEDSNSNGPYFLYVGGYDKRKGLELLLKTFVSLFQTRKIGGRLVLTGSQYYFSENFRQSVIRGTALGAVEEKGYVPDDRLIDLIQGATALVYPSKYEGFGLPPLEAMALGCPVITTRFTAIPEVCGDAVYYIDPENETDIAESLMIMEKNSELREHLRAMGRRRASIFSWTESANKFLLEVSSLIIKS